MRISDWSSDVCSSDLAGRAGAVQAAAPPVLALPCRVAAQRAAGPDIRAGSVRPHVPVPLRADPVRRGVHPRTFAAPVGGEARMTVAMFDPSLFPGRYAYSLCAALAGEGAAAALLGRPLRAPAP